MEVEKNTESITKEERILDAAHAEFIEKGYHGASMRDIADRAGIKKNLLYYYFSSKDKLFERIFAEAIYSIASRISTLMSLDIPMEERIDHIVESYMELLIKNPYLPGFVVNELQRNPDTFISETVTDEVKSAIREFVGGLEELIDDNDNIPMTAREFTMNMMSLIIFPFVGRPLFQTIFEMDSEEFNAVIRSRESHLKALLREMLLSS